MKTYTIKPLEWEPSSSEYQPRPLDIEVLTPTGRYFVFENNPGDYRWQFSGEFSHKVKTIAEAKAAAEAHYIQQMEKGLEATP